MSNASVLAAVSNKRRMIASTAVATTFEWYDFYLCTILAPYFSKIFFPLADQTSSFLSAFTAYAIGFIVRPFGALIFGYFGDTIGRKFTFIVTVIFMSFSTFAIGLLPTYHHVGWVSPAMLVLLRIIQGLAIGGEFGGAVIYVAEFISMRRRGFATSLIQITPTIGFLIAITVINILKAQMTEEQFLEIGWRIPFMISLLLLMISIYLRMTLRETPVFLTLRSNNELSSSPLRETLFFWPNLKKFLVSLAGCGIGQGVVANTAQFYTLFYVTLTVQLDLATAFKFVLICSVFGMAVLPFLGWVSDKVGRLKIMLLGFILAIVALVPAFRGLLSAGNPDLAAFREANPIVIRTNTSRCGFHLFAGPWSRFTACDHVRNQLAASGLSFRLENTSAFEGVELSIGRQAAFIEDNDEAGVRKRTQMALFAAGYPGLVWKYAGGAPQTYPDGLPMLERVPADKEKIRAGPFLANYLLIVLIAGLVYAPIGAFLSEYFPATIRYTAVSLTYHVANGWFGGVLQVAASALVVATGDTFAGLWYVIAGAALSLVTSLVFLRGQLRFHPMRV